MVRSSVSVKRVIVSLGERLIPWFLRAAEVSDDVRDDPSGAPPRPRTVSLTTMELERDMLSSNVNDEDISVVFDSDAVRIPGDMDAVGERFPNVIVSDIVLKSPLADFVTEFDNDVVKVVTS